MKDIVSRLPKPVAVIGANGFIGRHLVRYLRKSGVEPLCATKDNLWEEIILRRPQTIFNLASYGNRPDQKNLARIYDTNSNMIVSLLETLKEQGFKAFVNAGSSAEYGVKGYSMSEIGELRPNTHYAAAKASASHIIHYYGRTEKLPVFHLRLFAVYGSGDYESKLIPRIVYYGLQHKYPPLLKQNLRRDFVHVDDVCEAFIRAAFLQKENYGGVFNIGTGVCTSMIELADIAKSVFNIEEEPQYVDKFSEWDCWESSADMSKTKCVLGWLPEKTMKDGLIEMAKEDGRYAEFVS